MAFKSYFLTGLCCLCLMLTIEAQNTYSPYSVFGIGEINGMDLTHNLSMGGLGISNGDAFYLNNKNPALLTYNRVVVFETGLVTEQKSLKTTDLSQTNFTGGLNYLVFGFPAIRDRWTISFGLMPLSTVNYQSRQLGQVKGSNTQLTTSFEGSGGVSQAYFATGIKVAEGLSAGLRASYLFGSIRKETEFLVEDTAYKTILLERDAFSDYMLGLGLAYSMELKENENYLNIGVTYDLASDQEVSRLERLERRDLADDLLSPDDTLPYVLSDDVRGIIRLPATLGLGISYEKRLKWMVGADIILGNWSEYRDFDGDGGLNNRTEITLGGSWTPDIFSTSNYFSRVTYRLGINYQQTPYIANNQEINDFGINFGVTLPLRNLSRINLGFKVGQRGTTDSDLIKESYFRTYLGLTVNDNKWFIRRKFD